MSNIQYVKILEAFDHLTAGDVYKMVTLKRSGLNVKLTHVKNGNTFSLYSYQIAHALARGKIRIVGADSGTDHMQGELVNKLCHHSPDGYLY